MTRTHGLNLTFAFAPDAVARIDAARRAMQLIAEYREIEPSLSVSYAAEACRRVPFEQIAADWREAEGKFWFLATLAKKKVCQNLASLGGAVGMPDTVNDLSEVAAHAGIAAGA